MEYQVAEQLEDGRTYVVVTEDDGSTFGQIVDLRECETAEQQDEEVLKMITMARAAKAEESKQGRRRVPVIGERRVLTVQ
jgi:hypothetical protein